MLARVSNYELQERDNGQCIALAWWAIRVLRKARPRYPEGCGASEASLPTIHKLDRET